MRIAELDMMKISGYAFYRISAETNGNGATITSDEKRFVATMMRRMAEQKISQRELCRCLGVSKAYIAKVVTFESRPSTTLAIDIMTQLNFTPKLFEFFNKGYVQTLKPYVYPITEFGN